MVDKDQDVSVLSTESSSTIDVDHLDADSHCELEAINHLVERFEYTLQSAGADTDLIKPEFESLLVTLFSYQQLTTNLYGGRSLTVTSGLIYLYLFNCFLLCQPPMER